MHALWAVLLGFSAMVCWWMGSAAVEEGRAFWVLVFSMTGAASLLLMIRELAVMWD